MKLAHFLIGGFIIIAIFLAISQYISIKTSQESLQNTIAQETQATAINIMQDIERRLIQRIYQFQLLTQEQNVREFVKKANQELSQIPNLNEHINNIEQTWSTRNIIELQQNELSRKLTQIMKSSETIYGYPLFTEIFITNKYGTISALTGRTTDYIQNDEKWWTHAAAGGTHIEGLYYDESVGAESISMSIRINDENGELIGVMKVIMSLEGMISIIEDATKSLPPYSTIKWATEDGRIIHSNKPHKFLEYDPTTIIPPEQTNQIILGNKVLINAHSKLSETKWNIIIEQDLEYIFEPVEKLRQQLTTITIVALILSIIIGITITTITIRPIAKIKKSIDEISKGNFDVKLEKTHIDEINLLTESTERILTSLKLAVKRIGIKKEEIIPSEQHKAETEMLNVYKKNFENSPTSMLVAEYINKKPVIHQINKKFTEYYGYTEKETIGKSPSIVSSGKQTKKFYKEMWSALLNPKIGYWTGEITNKTKKGKLIKVILTINTIFDEDQPKYFIANHYKIPNI